MRLHLTDYHLEAARVIQAQIEHGREKGARHFESAWHLKKFTIIEDGFEKRVTKEEMNQLFKEHVAQAERLIQETGYHRRDRELEELRVIKDKR